ncbi:mercuric reductase [Grosmannia clavigera kw1407]|uniref:Mercuric reductase n=1 Tax=Grosmannia clavigera (strain kw1407 / UAMH 11150) TaxID=655863 RepID=F0XH00_GROCL|nr:mercuric reductase [Grosmannia clavigera kw1407]EFX03306.1 mercuric reductase [Grosmannia clavigera kw1407]
MASSSSSASTLLHYDDVVVGAGQSGCPLAIALAAAGRKTAVVERAHVGGTCVNVGCTPTKTLIASGRMAHLVRRARDYGVDPGRDDVVAVDMGRVRQRQRDMVSSFHAGSEARLHKAGVHLIRGEAAFAGPKTLHVTLAGTSATSEISETTETPAKTTLQADRIFLNVGERPLWPNNLPGLDAVADRSHLLDSTSILELDVVPRHLLVVSGSYVGLEFAQLFRRLGAAVTVVQRASQLLPRDDPDVAACLTDILRGEGMTVHLSAEVVHILLAAGRTPNTERLNLAAAGIRTTTRGHIVVDDRLATSCPDVYALGDVHGGPAFTHMAYDDYRILKANLLPSGSAHTKDMTTATSLSRRLVPYVVYTDPQLGHVGLHERDLATASGHGHHRHVKTATMPMSYVARALETDETRGMMKATVDADTGDTLGFSCLGIEGGEVMAVVQAAMMGDLKWWDLEAAIWAHPSLAESLNNLWALLK